jgi:hypothetical protein
MSGFEAAIPAVTTLAGSMIGQSRASDSSAAQVAAIERQNQVVEAQRAQQEKERKSLLDRQTATARARLAASGAGGDASEGSAAAILDGIAETGADDLNTINTQAALRTKSTSLLDGSDDLNWAGTGLDVFRSFYGATKRMG